MDYKVDNYTVKHKFSPALILSISLRNTSTMFDHPSKELITELITEMNSRDGTKW